MSPISLNPKKTIPFIFIFFLLLVSPSPLPAQLRLEYSTYLGGSGRESVYGIALWEESVYLTGATYSEDFPLKNPYQTSARGHGDCFITRLSSSGSAVFYSTYLGGDGYEKGMGIAVSGGSAYVFGDTTSPDFPTKNPYQPSLEGVRDLFVIRLSTSGSSLIYSTYLGGSFYDDATDMALSGGSAYLTGYTGSYDFPTKNPYQASKAGGTNAFITRFSSSGSSLIYSTYLGGGSNDGGRGIAVWEESVYLTGATYSEDFPLRNPYQTSVRDEDCFITRLSSSGSAVIYSTYLGGAGSDWPNAISVLDGFAYVTGSTSSMDFPTKNSYQASLRYRYQDAFIARLSATGSSLIYSTYLGGYGTEIGHGIKVSRGSAWIVGSTDSINFPTANPYQPALDKYSDGFVARFTSLGSQLFFSTYLGGARSDCGVGIVVSGNSAYVTGYTDSEDFPIRNPYQASKAGYSDIFVSKLVSLPTPTHTPTPYGYKSPTPTPSLTPTTTPTSSLTPTVTPTVTPTTTPYGFKTPTVTPTPSLTPSVIPSPSLTPTPLVGWSRETVDFDGDVGRYASLALDESGYPHIGYYDVTDGDLKYAYRDAAGWQTETVESGGNVGKGASLALDDAGRPHIAYYSTTPKTLRYSYKGLSGWQTETVYELSEYSWFCLSLDLDQENRPHISFGDNFDQMYAYRDLVGWKFETIAVSSFNQHYGWNASLKVDSDGRPHLSYEQFTLYTITTYSQNLHYAYRDSSGSWNLEFVNGSHSGWINSLALDSNDKPEISYMCLEVFGDYVLRLASKEGSEWVKTNLKYLKAGSLSSAHGKNDLPHLAYTVGGLWYNFGRSWELPSERVDAAASDDCSLALNRGDRPHIAYYDSNSGDLKYAVRDATPTPTPTPCDFRVISPNGGERWVMGRPAEIGWVDCGLGGEVTVNAYRAENLIRSFRAPNTGVYIIPKVPVVPAAAGCNYRIEVKLGLGVSDRSDNDFCIDTSTGNFRVISPNGGENWRMGLPATITWYDCGLGGNVTVNVYRAGRLVRSFRAPNTGSFTVPEIPTIPKAAGCNYRIGVWHSPQENDRSDGDFCITAGGGGSPVSPPVTSLTPMPIPPPTAPPPTPFYLVLGSGGDNG